MLGAACHEPRETRGCCLRREMEITRGDRDGSGPLPLDGVWELSVWAHSFARPEFSFGQNTNKLGELAQLARLSKV